MNDVMPPMPLPEPGSAAQQYSAALLALLQQEIEQAGGSISFARYQELVLYAPGLGYYSAGASKFGAAGDFVTAPELSPLFSRCLARQLLPVLAAVGNQLLEFGAGRGVMAADILSELAANNMQPERYCIVELSAELRQRQQALLQQRVPALLDRVEWLDGLPAGFSGICLANEVLDAMPVHRLVVTEQGVQELRVGWQDGLHWQTAGLDDAGLQQAVQTRMADSLASMPTGYIFEISLAIPAWLQALAEHLKRGAILLMDYGYDRREIYRPDRINGTLACYYRHRRHEDPFHLPGLQDITAQVDFTLVAEAATAAGLQLGGYTNQASFLAAAGIDELLAEYDSSDMASYLPVVQAVKKLLLPGEMGEVVKFMSFNKGVDEAFTGFSLKDLRGRL
jgi:SAM-dependent MidA family methyltransferase